MEYFENTWQHLLAELERIDLLIAAQVARARRTCRKDEQFRGLYIPEEEVDELLVRPSGRPRWAISGDGQPEVAARLEAIGRQVRKRQEESLRRGIDLRLPTLAQRFQLSPLEVDILLIALGGEMDLRYERLYAYLQDDVTQKCPSVDLALNLLTSVPETRFAATACFSTSAPLLRQRLIELVADPSHPCPPLLAKSIKIDDRVVRYLMGGDEPDHRIPGVTLIAGAGAPLEMLLVNEKIKGRMAGFIQNSRADGGVVILAAGPYGAGRQGTAAAVCRETGLRLMTVDLESMVASPVIADDVLYALVNREARLQNAAIYWKGFDTLLDEKGKSSLPAFIRHLQDRPAIAFLEGNAVWQPNDRQRRIPFIRVLFPKPDFRGRISIWEAALHGHANTIAAETVSALGTKFRFTGGQILDAAVTARHLARQRNSGKSRISADDLYAACHLHSNQTLARLASKITPKYRWTDIVLPADQLEQLREIVNYVKYRDRVYTEWGFGDKLTLGKGLSVLFTGPSGTGKTMAAEIIAGELGMELYKIDLSTVVSKYIGETEKNLSRIFSEAETSNAILFFDEADALFGKRSEVKDSHDRYANIETGYLLQRMEAYDGVVILATNFRKNMDEAFVRRLHFTVEFPFPNADDRLRIWESIWPENTPRDQSIDFALMARRFEISGGNIRNISLASSFLAANEGGVIGIQHLIRSTLREYQKMGKIINPEAFD